MSFLKKKLTITKTVTVTDKHIQYQRDAATVIANAYRGSSKCMEFTDANGDKITLTVSDTEFERIKVGDKGVLTYREGNIFIDSFEKE